jgi:branched-chain amino acid transport system substrate-binding protein
MMIWRKKTWKVIVLLALASGFTRGEVFAEETIKVGVLGPRSGPAVATRRAFEEGIAVALDTINDEQGGVLGKELEVIFEDSGGTPERAVSALEKLITRDGVVMTVGESHSIAALTEAALADQYQHPIIFAEAWADDITASGSKYVFRAGPCYSAVMTESLVNFASESGFKRVAIVAEKTDFGSGARTLAEEGLRQSGIEFLTVETERNSWDYSVAMDTIEEFGPDLVLVLVYGLESQSLLAQAREMKLCQGPALILDGAIPPSLWPQFWKDGNASGHSELLVVRMHPNVDLSPFSKRYAIAYQEKFGKVPVHSFSRSVFDVLLIAADAIRRTGCTDAELLVMALEQTNLEVAGGTVTFDLQPGSYRYHHWQPPVLIVQRQDGKETVIYPKRLATSELLR